MTVTWTASAAYSNKYNKENKGNFSIEHSIILILVNFKYHCVGFNIIPVKGRIVLMYFKAITVKGRPALQYILSCVIVILSDDS